MKRVEAVKRQLYDEIFEKYEEDTVKMESDDIQLKEEQEESEYGSKQYADYGSDSEYSSISSFNLVLTVLCLIGMYIGISEFFDSLQHLK